jgi:hypothetical protein
MQAADTKRLRAKNKTVTKAGEYNIQIGDKGVSFNYINNKAPSRTSRL